MRVRGLPQLLGATLALAGCGVHHSQLNAPGHVDPLMPPRQPQNRPTEEPADPGERMLTLSYGVLAGGGMAFAKNGDTSGAYGVGPELSLHAGSSDVSHASDDPPVLPQHALGLNMGWIALAHPGRGVGPVYGELQLTEAPYWLAGGWAWDVDEHRHGPQGTFGLGPIYLRVSHLFDEGTSVQAGLVFKGYQTWVRSK